MLDPGLWGGGLTPADVASAFGTVRGGGTTLAFEGGRAHLLAGVTDLAALGAQIELL